MANETWLQKKIDSVAGRVGYETERVILNVNEQIHTLMETQGVTRTELAQQLDVSKSYVSKMLNGTPNLTLRTLVSVANVLGCRVSITLTQQSTAATERPKVTDYASILRQREITYANDIAPVLEGFKPFVPPAPAPEKQNAAA